MGGMRSNHYATSLIFNCPNYINSVYINIICSYLACGCMIGLIDHWCVYYSRLQDEAVWPSCLPHLPFKGKYDCE